MSSKKSTPKVKKTPQPAKSAGKKNPRPKLANSKQVFAGKTMIVPVARDSKVKSVMAVQAATDMSTVRITGTEPLLSVLSNTAYTTRLDEYINPLNSVLFPKLSQEAALYDKFRFVRIGLRYSPRCPTTQTGQVGLLLLPDSHESEAPASMIELERYEHAVSSAVWNSSACHMTHKHAAQPWYYTAPPAEFASSTLGTVRTQSQGVVQISVSDANVVNTLCGVVEIEYEVELADRRPPYVSGFALPSVDLAKLSSNFSVPGRLKSSGGTTQYQATDLSPPSNTAYGFLSNFLTSDFTKLYPQDASATAAYIAALGLSTLGAKSSFLKLHQGISQVFLRANFGSVVMPLESGFVSVDQEDVKLLERPRLIRQQAVPYPQGKRSLLEADYPYISVRPSGTYGSFDNLTWTLLPPFSPELKAPLLTSGDVETKLVLYDPVLNTATVIFDDVTNSASSVIHTDARAIAVTTHYPVFLGLGTGFLLPSTQYRDNCYSSFGAVNNDST